MVEDVAAAVAFVGELGMEVEGSAAVEVARFEDNYLLRYVRGSAASSSRSAGNWASVASIRYG